MADNPDIVIATPSRALALLQSKVRESNRLPENTNAS
jgi:superfamily II DNA/RNA helicase